MKNILTFLVLPLLVFQSCEKKIEKKSEPLSHNRTEMPDPENDSLALRKLVRDLYQWNNGKNSKIDFDVLQNQQTDSTYASLDWEVHQQNLKELAESNLFAKELIDNYNKIAVTIDKKMRDRTLVYHVGELPPFGNGADPWCNCQDYPDNYWETLSIKKLSIKGNRADFVWTWGDDFEYKTKATKAENVWKISYLEGFDFNEFLR